jgi:sialic acid synthase SpsE
VLSRGTGGVDSAFSLEPAELAALVRESQVGWEALGEVRIGPTESEVEGLRFRRSLYVVADVRHGDPVTRDNVRSIRPAGGLPPDAIDVVLGRTFRSDAGKGTALTWDLV